MLPSIAIAQFPDGMNYSDYHGPWTWPTSTKTLTMAPWWTISNKNSDIQSWTFALLLDYNPVNKLIDALFDSCLARRLMLVLSWLIEVGLNDLILGSSYDVELGQKQGWYWLNVANGQPCGKQTTIAGIILMVLFSLIKTTLHWCSLMVSSCARLSMDLYIY